MPHRGHIEMERVEKQVITDEAGHPVAIQLDYREWLRIERALQLSSHARQQTTDLARFSGALRFREDPLAYQRRMRREWT